MDAADPIWIDLWIPSDDELFERDVARAAGWVGDCWAAALGGLGVGGLQVHRGPLVLDPGRTWCASPALGPGEVVAGDRKVVGVAQWRSRQGSLFHSAAYRRWDPALWTMLFGLDGTELAAMTAAVRAAGVGLDELLGPSVSTQTVVAAVLRHLPDANSWQVLPPLAPPG